VLLEIDLWLRTLVMKLGPPPRCELIKGAATCEGGTNGGSRLPQELTTSVTV
jgi:hypothetical protein